MRTISYVIITATAISLAGCSDKKLAAEQVGSTAVASVSANTEGQRVELLATPTAPDALPLNPGSSVSGTFISPRSGAVASFSVQVGNYSNTADGSLAVKICQKDVCQTGSSDLSHSIDNHALEIVFGQPLNISTDTPVAFSLTKTDGIKPVAIWTYELNSNWTEMRVSNGMTLARAPNITLTFSK